MREAEIERKTKETEIRLKINLDGTGESQIDTGIGFFDHMLISMARFGYFDLDVSLVGDLQVDAHHTIEDCGIVLGQAIAKALGERRGIERIGDALLPMDEALVQVALDLSNRPYLAWNVPCPDGMVGEFPVEMAEEFFRAVAVHGGITLHINLLAGKNRHHILEAVFKAFGRALGKASGKNRREEVLSTKGVL